MMRAVDLVVLCLPDDAAKEAVSLADELGGKAPRSSTPRLRIAWRRVGSTALPNSTANRRPRSASAQAVANPGCYPTGAIALLRPLVDAGIVPADYPVTVNAVSGYSGGGRA